MLPTELHELIASVVRERPPQARVGEFVLLCRKIALVQLRRKSAAARLQRDLLRVPIEDLALDCIADLLQQDEDGRLIQVAVYFESLDYDALSEEELLAFLSRLIFAKVNQGIFRLYNEHDPSLGKILRNMKLAFQSLQTFAITDRFGEQWIAPTACETLEHLPVIEREELDMRIRGFFHADDRVPQLLAKLASYLRSQSDHSRLVPLMVVAFVLRSIYTADNERSAGGEPIEEQLLMEDSARIISQTCRRLMKEHSAKYVEIKGVPRDVFLKYFEVIERNVRQRLLGEDGDVFSFFDSLRLLMPEMTKEEYAHLHRSRLEYLARLAYDEAVKELRKNL